MNFKRLLKKRYIFGAVLIVIVVIVILSVVNQKPDLGGDILVVERKDLAQEVELSGQVKAKSDILIAAEASGIVKEVLVQTGDIVEEGQRVMSLDQKDALVGIAKAKAGVSAEEAKLAELYSETEGGSSSSEREAIKAQQDVLVVKAYEELLNSDLQAYPENEKEQDDLVGAPLISGTYGCEEEGSYIMEVYRSVNGSSFRHSGLEYGTQAVSTDHYLSMGDCGLYVKFEEDYESKGSWIVPIPNVRSSTYATVLGVYNSALKNRDVALSQATVKTEDILVQEARLAEAQASLMSAYNTLNNLILTSPIDGIIASVDVDPGEFVASGQEVSRIISDGDLEIVAYVPEIDLGKLEIGTQADITLESYGDDEIFSARLVSIAPSAETIDSVPSYEVKLVFNFPDEKIKSGMTADIIIKTGERKGVIAVPARAIAFNGRTKSVVVVYEDGTTEERIITTGLRSSTGEMEIISGLEGGESILLNFNK